VRRSLLILGTILWAGMMAAQEGTLRGKVAVLRKSKKQNGSSDVVVWLTPYDFRPTLASTTAPRLVQKDKQFTPHVVAVTVGSKIDFPNRDPFFHDVFSIYHGRPFDLGLYESGSTRSVGFIKPGLSYIFCNIHPQMSAVVVALETPYFAQTTPDGGFQIEHLPPGRYKLRLWHEFTSDAELDSLIRDVKITNGDNALPEIPLHSSDGAAGHPNKYGEPYETDKPTY